MKVIVQPRLTALRLPQSTKVRGSSSGGLPILPLLPLPLVHSHPEAERGGQYGKEGP